MGSNKQTMKQTTADAQTSKAVTKGGRLLKQTAQAVEAVLEEQDYSSLENVSKASLVRIELSLLPKEIPDFDAPGATKDSLIAAWLTQWIQTALKAGKLTECHLLPRKEELAKYLGVSIGTVQNAIRYVEDDGHVESKQRIGTLIRNAEQEGHRLRKQTSKRDQAVLALKKFISDRGYNPGEVLPSAREISKLIGSAPNTTRLALEFLSSQGCIESRGTRGNKANWLLKSVPDTEGIGGLNAIESETLIDQLERDLKALIAHHFEVSEKLPSHLELADQFKVSIKTVHDAMKRLCEQGIVQSKRGRYGTYIVRKPDASMFLTAADTSIFLPAQDASFYNYEKVERHLKQLISKQYPVGEKLPSMGTLAEQLDVSSNTIRKALQNLAQENIVSFTRGRYGGTFVLQQPEVDDASAKTFTWVSINPETVKTYRTTSKAHS